MSAFTKQFLSGSTNGRAIKVVATATAGTLIHTADAIAKDEIYLFAVNTDTVDRELTLEWGGVTDPDDLKPVTIKFRSGEILIIGGEILSGGLIVRAFAAVANVINISGFVNRIS